MTEQLAVDNISDYEKIRLQNIARNEEFLKNLGLDLHIKPITILEEPVNHRKKSKLKINPEHDETLHNSNVRRSSRLNSNPKEPEIEIDNDFSISGDRVKSSKRGYTDEDIVVDDTCERKIISASELREYIKSSDLSHHHDISNSAIQHCIMRIQSMSNKALLTRLRRIVIYEKLIVFYYALVLSELLDLAEVAAYYLYNSFKVSVDLHAKKVSEVNTSRQSVPS